MRLILLSALIATQVLATEECNQEELNRQCFTKLCTFRNDIPDTIDGIRSDISQSRITLPAAAISGLDKNRRQVGELRAALAPAADSEYEAIVDTYISNPDLAGTSLTRISQRLQGNDDRGRKIFNDMLSPEETQIVENGSNALSTYYDRTRVDMEEEIRNNSPYEADEATLRTLSEMETFIRTTNPERAQGIAELRILLAEKKPVPDAVFTRANLRESSRAYSSDFLRTNKSTFASYIRLFERSVVERSAERIDRNLNNCQLVEYLHRKTAVANNPANLRRMAVAVIASVESKFYPRLSTESAATLRAQLKPEAFKLIHEKPDFSGFIPVTMNPASTREGKIMALDTLSQQGCTIKYISDEVGGDYVGQDVGASTFDIMISPLTLAQNAEAVLAHEIGHFITTSLRSHPLSSPSMQKLVRLRSCLSSMHPGETRPGTGLNSISGDRHYTDEDFGDWMAASLGYNTEYLGCDLGRMLDIGSRAPERTLVQTVTNDAHSTDVFRLLHTRTIQGTKIPQVCRELLAQTPEEQPKKCELE